MTLESIVDDRVSPSLMIRTKDSRRISKNSFAFILKLSFKDSDGSLVDIDYCSEHKFVDFIK